jgi:hypothetical protein
MVTHEVQCTPLDCVRHRLGRLGGHRGIPAYHLTLQSLTHYVKSTSLLTCNYGLFILNRPLKTGIKNNSCRILQKITCNNVLVLIERYLKRSSYKPMLQRGISFQWYTWCRGCLLLVTPYGLLQGHQRFGRRYWLHLQGWSWRQFFFLKLCWLLTSPHSVTAQDIFTNVRASNLIYDCIY